MSSRLKKVNKRAVALIAATLISIIVCASVIAYQTLITDDVVNEIKLSKLNVSISEETSGAQKEEIIIKADKDNSEAAYVRVALIANWVDESDSGTIYLDPVPDLSEYINTDKWVRQEVPVSDTSEYNVYYKYYKGLEADEATDNILKEPINLKQENGKKLEITVLVQAADKDTFEGSMKQ